LLVGFDKNRGGECYRISGATQKGQNGGIDIPGEQLQFQIGSPEKRDETILLLSGEESHPVPAFKMLVPGHHGQIVYFRSRKDEPVRYTAFKFSP
jgi:hypothetical protein